MRKIKVENGKIVNKQKNKNGVFDCSRLGLTTLENSPRRVSKSFKCSDNNLTTLKGCPDKVNLWFICNNNPLLTDVSDLPTMVELVWLQNCSKVEVFTKDITNKDGIVSFVLLTDEVRQRIKEWPYYDVIKEVKNHETDSYNITVKIKNDNEFFMNSL